MTEEQLTDKTKEEVFSGWFACEYARWEVNARLQALGVSPKDCPEEIAEFYQDWLDRVAEGKRKEKLEKLAEVLNL